MLPLISTLSWQLGLVRAAGASEVNLVVFASSLFLTSMAIPASSSSCLFCSREMWAPATLPVLSCFVSSPHWEEFV